MEILLPNKILDYRFCKNVSCSFSSVKTLQTAAEAAGMTVQTTASPWQLNAADDHAFLTRFLTDRITAATEYEPASADLFADWLNDRLADASLTVTVDHRDLLILPTTPGEER